MYLWGSQMDERHKAGGEIPLFLESGTRWVESHRGELLREFGDAVAFDVADPMLIQRGELGTRNFAEQTTALTRTALHLKQSQVPAVFVLFPLNYSHPEVADSLRSAILGRLTDTEHADLHGLFAGLPSDDLRRFPERDDVFMRQWDVIHFGPVAMHAAAYCALSTFARNHSAPQLNRGLGEIRKVLVADGAFGRRLEQRLDAACGPLP